MPDYLTINSAACLIAYETLDRKLRKHLNLLSACENPPSLLIYLYHIFHVDVKNKLAEIPVKWKKYVIITIYNLPGRAFFSEFRWAVFSFIFKAMTT